MTAKEYLEQLSVLNEMIDQNVERLGELRELAGSTGGIQYGERVQTSPSGDVLEKKVVKYVQLEQEISNEIDKFADAKEQIIREIRGLHNKNYIQVLYKIYVQFKSVRDVSKEIGKSYGYTIELHNKALSAFKNTYQNLSYLC